MRVNSSQILLVGIFIYGAIGLFLEMEREFYLYGLMAAMIMNAIFAILSYRWHMDQQTYIFYVSLLFIGYYQLDHWYYQTSWGDYAVWAYLFLIFAMTLFQHERLNWSVKIVRQITFLMLLIFLSHDPIQFMILTIIMALIFIIEEGLLIKRLSFTKVYLPSDLWHTYLDWGVLMGYLGYYYLVYDAGISL